MADHCVAAGPEKLWVPDPTSNTASPRPAAPGKPAMAAGVIINMDGETFNSVIGTATPCSTGPSCTWEASMVGGWVYGPDYEPTGEEIFGTGAGANKGSYSNTEMNKLIAETNTSSSLAIYHTFATYAAEQLPSIWMPDSAQVMAVSKNLRSVVFNPLQTLMPGYWYLTKS